MPKISIYLLILTFLIFPATAAASTLYVESGNISTAGETTNLTIYLDSAPYGLSGYNLTVTILNPNIAQITAVSFPPWADLNAHSPLPSGTCWIAAADLGGSSSPGNLNIPLATLTLEGISCGDTAVTLLIQSLHDQNGTAIDPIIHNGTFIVGLLHLPTAAFHVTPQSGSAPLSVQFVDDSTGVVTDYFWDFGDGNYSSRINPEHTYRDEGNYTAYMTVYNMKGHTYSSAPIQVGPATHQFTRQVNPGWNILSTPVLLESGKGTMAQIFPPQSQERISVILGWNGQIWFIPGPEFVLSPLDAVFVKADGTADAVFIPTGSLSTIPSRALPRGINLIGPAPAYNGTAFPPMPVNQALVSIEYAPGGLTGYTMVVSPPYNQPSWAFARNGTPYDLLPYDGYWVVMENPDILYGFSTTPLPG